MFLDLYLESLSSTCYVLYSVVGFARGVNLLGKTSRPLDEAHGKNKFQRAQARRNCTSDVGEPVQRLIGCFGAW